jgi:hypothetical protein
MAILLEYGYLSKHFYGDILEYVRIYPKVNIHMWKTPMVSIRGHDLPTMPHVSLQEVLHIYGSVITRDLTVIDGWYRKVG